MNNDGLNRYNVPRFERGQQGLSADHLNKMLEFQTRNSIIRGVGVKVTNTPSGPLIGRLRRTS